MKFQKYSAPSRRIAAVVGHFCKSFCFIRKAACRSPQIRLRCCSILLNFITRSCYILIHALSVSAMYEFAVADKFQKLRCHRRWQIVEIGERSRSKKGAGGQIVKLLKIETTLAVEHDAVQDASPSFLPRLSAKYRNYFRFHWNWNGLWSSAFKYKTMQIVIFTYPYKHLPFSTAREDLCLLNECVTVMVWLRNCTT